MNGSFLFNAGRIVLAAQLVAALLICMPGPACGETPEQIDSETTLLVIDVQEFYFPGGAVPLVNPEAAASNCRRLLEKFRSENRRVVHIGHKTAKGGAFHSDVIPQCEEKIFMKSEVTNF